MNFQLARRLTFDKPGRGRVYDSLLETIGNTPLVALDNLFSEQRAKVFAKLEFFNPTGSIKDRIVKHIVAEAEAINQQKIEAEGIVMDSSSWVISATNPGA